MALEKAMNTLLTEFGQLHKYDIFDPQRIKYLTNEVKREALNLITMVKRKKCGKIKARV